MSEHRKHLQRDLLAREKESASKSASKSVSGKDDRSTTSTSATTHIFNPKNPKYSLILQVKSTSPLPLTPTNLSACLLIPASSIEIHNQQVCAEFEDAQKAAEILGRVPFDAVRSGDWFLGYPPVELFEAETVVETSSTHSSAEKRVKVTRAFESEVLKRLREAAKQQNKTNQTK
jgi:hypothetical protein